MEPITNNCLGDFYVTSVYDIFHIPHEHRYRARLTLVYHRPEIGAKQRALLHNEQFSDIDGCVAGLIYAANQFIRNNIDEWVSKKATQNIPQERLAKLCIDVQVTPEQQQQFHWPNPSVTIDPELPTPHRN